MPTSIDVYNHDVLSFVLSNPPRNVLDVGAGKGKYADLLNPILPEAKIDAIEPFDEYVAKYGLLNKYRKVYVNTIQEFVDNISDVSYDLCIMGDVIEHMYLDRAISVVDALLYHCKFVAIIWPSDLPQHAFQGNDYEMHKCNPKLTDFTRFNVQIYKKTFGFIYNNVPVDFHYVLLAGHTTTRQEYARRLHVDYKTNTVLGVINSNV